MRPYDSDEQNQNDNSMDAQQDSVGINNANMPQVEHNNRPKVIRTRSGKISCRPQRLGIIKE